MIPEALSDLVISIRDEAAEIGRTLHPDSVRELRGLVRIMNAYYSNLIEGHNTRPRDKCGVSSTEDVTYLRRWSTQMGPTSVDDTPTPWTPESSRSRSAGLGVLSGHSRVARRLREQRHPGDRAATSMLHDLDSR